MYSEMLSYLPNKGILDNKHNIKGIVLEIAEFTAG